MEIEKFIDTHVEEVLHTALLETSHLHRLLRLHTYHKRLRVQDVCSFLPKQYRAGYRIQLRELLQEKKIGWDGEGVIHWDQCRPIPNSHIVTWLWQAHLVIEGEAVPGDNLPRNFKLFVDLFISSSPRNTPELQDDVITPIITIQSQDSDEGFCEEEDTTIAYSQ